MIRWRGRAAWLVGITGMVIMAVHGGSLPLAGAAAGEVAFVERFPEPGGLPAHWSGTGEVVSNRGWGSPQSLRIDDRSTAEYAGAYSRLIAVDPERHYDLSLYLHADAAGSGGRMMVRVDQHPLYMIPEPS